jgi:hypothetical protein
MQIGASLVALAPVARAASNDNGPLVQPLAGWLLGVLAVLVISLLSRHRPSKFGRARVKWRASGES